jgi:enamine deaminase RidA (YjgF/YER057c/UK114 family)
MGIAPMMRRLRQVEERLAGLGIDLPPAPAPVGNYRRGVVRGQIGVLSGQFPLRDGKALYTGRLGEELSLEEGQAAARAAALNVLAQLRELLGSFAPLDGLLRVDGFVASGCGFVQQPAVLDGASNFLVEVLGERGAHARTAIGVSSLPMNMPVELAVTFAVRPARPFS